MSVAAVSDRKSHLGEGPHWDPLTQTLYHVDAFVGDVCQLNPTTGVTNSFHLDGTVTSVIPYYSNTNDLLVTRGKDVIKLNWVTQLYDIKTEVDPGNPTRFNDSKCDSTQRLWTGTLQEGQANKGSLYSMDGSYNFTSWADSITVSNGITWNLDETKMYYIDSEDKKIYVFDFDVGAGVATNQRVLVDYNTTPGYENIGVPDGMTTDINDKLWVACYGGGRVIRIDPETSDILQTVEIPAPKTTSCCFGGPHFNILYVTTGTADMTDEELSQLPTAGSVFAVTGLGTQGNPANKFRENASSADSGNTVETEESNEK